jgi:sortase B
MSSKRKIVFLVCFMAILLGVGGYAVYQLYLSNSAYSQGDQAYQQIEQQVISENVSSTTKDKKQSSVFIPNRKVDFDVLKAINSDSIGWLYCPDTVIDYPVMSADDYTYYLSHLPDGTENFNGSLFLDYNCASDFSDELSVIYGHSMKNGKMFGTLTGYKNQSYFEQHPYMYLYTEKQNYRIALVYGAVVSADEWINNGYAQNADKLLKYAKSHTTFESTEKCDSNQRFIVMSTCSYEYDDARYFVVGVLQSK